MIEDTSEEDLSWRSEPPRRHVGAEMLGALALWVDLLAALLGVSEGGQGGATQVGDTTIQTDVTMIQMDVNIDVGRSEGLEK